MKHTQRMLLALAAAAIAACSIEEGPLPGNDNNTNPKDTVISIPSDTAAVLAIADLELPRPTEGDLKIVHRTMVGGRPQTTYTIGYDPELKHSRWVALTWSDVTAEKNWNRKQWPNGDPFAPDPSLDAEVRHELSDYVGDGYDRGHICASADRLYSKEANEQTFYLSNMSPQLHSFNAGIWETAESVVRSWAENSHMRDTLYVAKGGTIAEGQYRREPKHNKVVPDYYFMAVLCRKDNEYNAIGLYFEHKANSGTNLTPYVCSIDKLEMLTGLDFFYNLPDDIENRVEARVTGSWPGIDVAEESNDALLYNSLMDDVMPQDFSVVAEHGSTDVWTPTKQYGLKASAYIEKKNTVSESWLVMPTVSGAKSMQLMMAVNYLNGEKLTNYVDLLVTTDLESAPSNAQWTSVLERSTKLPKGDNWAYTKVEVDLSDFGGKPLRIAVRYKSTVKTAPTLEMKELVVK